MLKKLLLISIFLTTACSNALAEESAGKIAVLVPQNGPFASYGNLQMQGYELARVDLARQNLKVEVRYFDIGSCSGSIAGFLDSEVLKWEPELIVGPYSSDESEEVIQHLRVSGVPLILPSATQDNLTRSGAANVFRVATPSGILAGRLVDFVSHLGREDGKALNVTIVVERSSFADSAKAALEEAFVVNQVRPHVLEYTQGNLGTAMSVLAGKKSPIVIMISREVEDCRQLTSFMQGKGTVVGFLAGFLTPAFRTFATQSGAEVFLLNPWQDDAPSLEVGRFTERFLNKYKAGLAVVYPQYHNVQAYSSLMIAGEALQLSSSSQKPLTKVLREETFETPLGSISFVQFGGYVQQCTLSPVIQKVEKGAISTVYPPDRVFDVVEKAQPGTPTQEIKSSFLKTLFDNQFIALFGILALGLLLGNVRVWGVSLGNSGVLFTALLFGHFHFTIPAGVGTLGLILFIYCVGISAGPSFFAAFRKQGANLAKLSILIVSAASLCTVWMAWLFKVPADLAVGILAGSLTSTPALAAAMDTLKDLGTNVSVGYGIAYPFGVIGVVLFVQLLPRLLGKDLDQLAATLEDAGKSGKSIQAVLVEVTNESIVGKSIEECAFIANTHCRISRRLMGEQLVPVQYDTCFEKGQVLRVVGREKELAGVIEFLGKKVDLPHVQDSRDYDVMELVVTNREFAGKMLGELQLLKRFGVTITRIKRNEVEFVPRMENKIDLQDVIRVVGDPEGIKQVAAECGHKARALQETDLVSLFVGLLLGVVLGLLPISIAGARNFTFGLSGGVLFVALLLGHFGRVGRVVGRMPFAARMLLMELGLVFFLANAGVRAGGSFMQVVGVHGVQLFLVGAVVTLVPMIAGFIFSTYFLKMDLLRTLGGICGGMTSTPALGAIKSKTDSGLPVVSYAAAYPVALILMLVAAQLVIFVLKLL